jgi:hypothetical protein
MTWWPPSPPLFSRLFYPADATTSKQIRERRLELATACLLLALADIIGGVFAFAFELPAFEFLAGLALVMALVAAIVLLISACLIRRPNT